MKLRLLYHGHCFDGVASAAVFTRFYASQVNREAEIEYAALLHRPGALFDEEMFKGDENAIVDFKYSPSERLTWWFDHHQSAFLSAEDEAHFRADTSGQKFWNPDSKSCTEFIEHVIRELTRRPLEEVAVSREVQERFRPLLDRHRETLETIRRKATYARGVINFDLVDEGLEGFNKFIPYYVRPETTYSVAVTRGSKRAKVSVGSNPFSPRPRRHNIASICERYGGGGHAVVGAVSYAPDEVERARSVAA